MALDTLERVTLDVDGHRVALCVLELGLACCGLEVRAGRRLAEAAGQLISPPDGESSAAELPVGATPYPGAKPDPGASSDPGAELNLLVVAGTVTARLAPTVRTAWQALPEPRAVLAFGACTATGGPYWDSYAVLPGAHELVPVAAWVPGCPPRPQELLDGVREVLRARD